MNGIWSDLFKGIEKQKFSIIYIWAYDWVITEEIRENEFGSYGY